MTLGSLTGSCSIFIQDIPNAVSRVEEIPDDWIPSALPFGHANVITAVRVLVPETDLGDLEWLRVTLPGAHIEVNVANETALDSFTLHARAGDTATDDHFISGLLE